MGIWEDKVSGKICAFCNSEPEADNSLHFICEMRVSKLYLTHDQSFMGRVVLVYHEHQTELHKLVREDSLAYYQDMLDAAEAVSKAFKPDKFNYLSLGDLTPHLHWHIVPRYKNGPYWGQNFMGKNIEPVYLEEEEYLALIEKIKRRLNEIGK